MRPNGLPVRPSYRNAAACAIAVGVAVLLTHPVLEMGINDDWSYTKTAFDFARTGHIVYNGWGSPTLGWQILWGALFAKLSGYSFTATRLSTLPFAFGAPYLLYLILARFGASSWNAAIGSLTLGLSPMFIPLAASFMTDVPAVFCILLCLYMCQRAVQAPSDRSAIAWLCAAAACNVVDGTIRQIVWLGSLVMVPSAAWLLRKRRRVVSATACIWVLSLVPIVACGRWFQKQPYTVPLNIWEPPARDLLSLNLIVQMTLFFLTLAVFSLPLLISFVHRIWEDKQCRRAAVTMMLCIAAGLILPITSPVMRWMLGTWLPDIVGKYGMHSYPELSPRQITLTEPVQIILTFCTLLAAGSLCMVVLYQRRHIARQSDSTDGDTSNLRAAWALSAPFALSYGATLMLRAMHHGLFDRYIIPILPIAIILSTLCYQGRSGYRFPRLSSATLIVFGVYGVAATHDYFSAERARLSAAQQMERAGIPRHLIHGSAEYDAWTQLEASGHMNHQGIKTPADAYQAPEYVPRAPKECRSPLAAFIPAVHPEYFVVFQSSPCFDSTSFSPTPYRAWLPPFSRSVYIQKQKPGRDWLDDPALAKM